MKKYNNLWVFGDSFSTPNFCVEPADSFWGLAAVDAQVQLIHNYSWPGTSFSSVLHMLVTMQDQLDFAQDLIFVCVPPLERLTVFDNFKDTRWTGSMIEPGIWKQQSVSMDCMTGLEHLQSHQDKMFAIHEDRSWTEAQAMRDIFFLTQWLDSHRANYMVLNLSKPFDENSVWNPSTFLLPYCLNHPRCMLYKDTYQSVNYEINPPADFDQYGWHGHHGPVGNHYFYDQSLKPTMLRIGLL